MLSEEGGIGPVLGFSILVNSARETLMAEAQASITATYALLTHRNQTGSKIFNRNGGSLLCRKFHASNDSRGKPQAVTVFACGRTGKIRCIAKTTCVREF